MKIIIQGGLYKAFTVDKTLNEFKMVGFKIFLNMVQKL